jgi:hypothetical protein
MRSLTSALPMRLALRPMMTLNFCYAFYFFFWKSISRIREKEQKLGPITLLQRGPPLGNDPVSHFRLVATRPTLRGPVQRRRRHLNQDRSNFFGRGKRRESKWDLDSRNVPYGIFSATPKKRAK